LTLVFFAYPIAAILAHPDWAAVARGMFIPTLQGDPDYLILLVGLIGTTITPYMQLFQQSAVVEKAVGRDDYGPERTDAIAGSIFGNVTAAFIIIATAATLHVAGITDIQTHRTRPRRCSRWLATPRLRCFRSGSSEHRWWQTTWLA
jgi:Mn2+/Fe2+ NRAMP family transporter